MSRPTLAERRELRRERPYDYLIYKRNGYYWAKNGRTNEVEFWNDDASQVILNALSALPDIGGKIFFKPGVYPITAAVTITKSGVILDGEKAVLKQADNANLSAIICIDSAHDIIIRNLTIDGNRANNTSGTGMEVKGESHRGVIENVKVYRCYTGIALKVNAYLWSVLNCHVEDCYETGIAVINREQSFWGARANIRGNKVVKTGHHGILLSGASDCIVAENICYDIGTLRTDGYAHGIALDGDEGNRPCYNNKVIGNFIYNTRLCGIEVADAQHWVEIIGNHVDKVASYGVYFGGGLAPSLNAVICGNIVHEIGECGIAVVGTSDTERTKNVVVEGNIVFECDKDGIWTKWVEAVQIISNLCFNNSVEADGTFDGIHIDDADGLLVMLNKCFDTRSPAKQKYGIDTAGTVDAIIAYNDCRGNLTGAINPMSGVICRRNRGYVTENSGVATFSGDASTTQFTIPHGLVAEPEVVNVTPLSADAAGDFYVTKDADNIYVNYLSAPPSGTDNVVLAWRAEV